MDCWNIILNPPSIFLIKHPEFQIIRTGSTWSGFLVPWNAANQWLVGGENPYSDTVRIQAQEMIYNRPAVVSSGEEGCHLTNSSAISSAVSAIWLASLRYRACSLDDTDRIKSHPACFLGIGLADWKPGWSSCFPDCLFSALASIFASCSKC